MIREEWKKLVGCDIAFLSAIVCGGMMCGCIPFLHIVTDGWCACMRNGAVGRGRVGIASCCSG